MTKTAALENHDRDIKINALCPVALTVMGHDYFTSRDEVDQETLDTAYVTPIALYLSHQDCAFTGETLSAGAGKWLLLFSGKARGPDKITKELDDVFANIDTIMDYNHFDLLKRAQA